VCDKSQMSTLWMLFIHSQFSFLQIKYTYLIHILPDNNANKLTSSDLMIHITITRVKRCDSCTVHHIICICQKLNETFTILSKTLCSWYSTSAEKSWCTLLVLYCSDSQIFVYSINILHVILNWNLRV